MTMIYQDDRTWLYAEHDERYALGDPASPILVLNDVDADQCAWAADRPEGADFPEVDTPMDTRQEGHGGYSGEPTFEPRTLVIEGTVAAPSRDLLRAARRRLTAALLGAIPGFVRFTLLDEDPARGLWVKPSGQPKWRALSDRVAEFAFVVVADDPIWTGPALPYGPVRLPTAAGEGGYPIGGAGGAVMPWTSVGSSTLAETRRNLHTNPRAVSTGTPWVSEVSAGTGTTTYLTGQTVPFAGGPTTYARTTVNTTGGGFARISCPGTIATNGFPVVAGLSYAATVWGRPSAARSTRAVISWYSAAGAYLSDSAGVTAAQAAAAIASRSVVAVAPVGAALARVHFQADASAVNDTVDATAAVLEQAAAANTYMDGLTTDASPLFYDWTGPANASASVQQTLTVVTSGTNARTVAAVDNDGDEWSHAIYTVTGPVPRPIIALGTGEFVALTDDLGALDTWVVDTAAGTSTVNGVNRYDAWGAGSTFPLIPPGGTELRLRSALGGVNPAAGLSVLTASSWK